MKDDRLKNRRKDNIREALRAREFSYEKLREMERDVEEFNERAK